MPHNLDQTINRCGTDSVKWSCYPQGTLPLWVADMDFRAPEAVIEALHRRVEHGVFGYGNEPTELRDVVIARVKALYDWDVSADWVVFLPGVVTGFNLVCQALTTPGDGVLVQTPAYPPILCAAGNAQCARDEAELTCGLDGRYTVDLEQFEAAIHSRTRVFVLCNPHNPVGRVFTRPELESLAELCLRHRVAICSDEIHCDFVYRGQRHIPIASLSPEVADQTITLLAPSKTFNIPGLHCAVGIVPNARWRAMLEEAKCGMVGEPDILSLTAALAAYRDGGKWLEELLIYLEDNRDFVRRFVTERLPGMRMAAPEGTYLAWLDCRAANLPANPGEFFLKHAQVALMPGPDYGRGGEGFLRLNFGCPRSTLRDALERMERALRTGPVGATAG